MPISLKGSIKTFLPQIKIKISYHCMLVISSLSFTFPFPGYIKMSSLDSEASSDMATNSYRHFDKAYRSIDAEQAKSVLL